MGFDLADGKIQLAKNRSNRAGERVFPCLSAAIILSAAALLSSCNSSSQVLSHGYQASQDTLDQVPVGSSHEQVLLALGTPSTTINQGEREVFYYISQTKKRSVAFAKPRIVDQKVLAIYFGTDRTVNQIANYGLKDGKVFDYISRTTPTSGSELTFLGQVLGAAGSGAINPFGG